MGNEPKFIRGYKANNPPIQKKEHLDDTLYGEKIVDLVKKPEKLTLYKFKRLLKIIRKRQ